MLLITGASGRIATRVAEILAGHHARMRLMSRTPEHVQRRRGAEVVYGDFAVSESLGEPFAGITTALVISGGAPPGERAEEHKRAFHAAARGKAMHVIYLSLKGASAHSAYPYSRDHLKSERYLEQVGVPFTVLRNAFYLDQFFAKAGDDGVIRGPGGSGRGAFVSREDAARAAAAAVMSGPRGVVEITGPELLSIADVAARLSAITGRAVRYEDEPADVTAARLAKSDQPIWKQKLEVGWFEAIARGEQAPVSDGARELIGEDPLTLEAYVALRGSAL